MAFRNYNYTFIQPDPGLQNNLMAFGYECGDGWLPIIYEAFDKIQEIVNANRDDELVQAFTLLQVKEKYGTLTIYFYGGNEQIEKIIQDAENKSATVCEDCGREGKLKEIRHWYYTICDECERLMEEKRKELYGKE